MTQQRPEEGLTIPPEARPRVSSVPENTASWLRNALHRIESPRFLVGFAALGLVLFLSLQNGAEVTAPESTAPEAKTAPEAEASIIETAPMQADIFRRIFGGSSHRE